MSLLNKDAIKVILITNDILSEQGIIQSVWDTFTEKVKYRNNTKTILDVILKSIGKSVIQHLKFSDKECSSSMLMYHKMVNDIRKMGVSTSNLSSFIYVLDDALSDYLSINDKYRTNIKINIDGDFGEPSYRDQSKILSSMMKNGLVDSYDIQSLLDGQNLSMIASANRCMSVCRGGEPLVKKNDCGVRIASELSLNDFGTCVEELIGCVGALIEADEDLFPKSPEALRKVLFPKDDFDIQKLFHRDAYIPNLANYGIISASLQKLENSFDMDDETALYQITSLMNQLKGFIEYFDKATCLLLYMVSASLVVRYLKKSLCGDANTLSAIYTIKKNIANAYSMFMSLDESEPSKTSDMFSIPKELKNFVNSAEQELSVGSLFGDNDSNNCSDMKAVLNDILSGINETKSLVENYYNSEPGNIESVYESDTPSALSSLMESSGFEQARDKCRRITVDVIREAGNNFHDDLNHSLLGGNFENAANQIALEVALLKQIDNRSMDLSELNPLVETLRRDILTYSKRVDYSSNGVLSYQDSANAYIASLLGNDE